MKSGGRGWGLELRRREIVEFLEFLEREVERLSR